MSVPIERIALNRMAFGPSQQDLAAIGKAGLAAFVEQQLHPDDASDVECQRILQAAQLHIEYDAAKNDKGEFLWHAVKENRPLRTLDQSSAEIWKLTGQAADPEKQRPLVEVKAAMWIRAVHGRWQLREVLVDFWHNHFNVNTSIDDNRAATMLPIHDRDVIRKHCLGNFRQMLEAVACSVPMLVYLNNGSSKASPANENFARELFELHTLGAEAYYNHLYNRWRDVPGAVAGKPVGYIDEDVYEAARAFTGWTFADGSDDGHGDNFLNTGAFHYCAAWHDPYQKRVLGVEFEPNTPPLADGRRVLDLLARHPATATHMATKLCRRLVAEDPPPSLISAASAEFLAAVDQPDQIARVVRKILLSQEFAGTSGQRVKKPFELAVSFMRTTGATVSLHGENDDSLIYLLDPMGQYLFSWPTPTGHPESAAHWTGTGAMLARWNMPIEITSDDFKAIRIHLLRQTPIESSTWRQVAQFWVDRIIGQPLSPEVMTALVTRLSDGQNPDAAPDVSDRVMLDRLNALVSSIAMLPEFQRC